MEGHSAVPSTHPALLTSVTPRAALPSIDGWFLSTSKTVEMQLECELFIFRLDSEARYSRSLQTLV